MKSLFSINKAAEVLERDRATLVRALRHTKPDGTERGQPRYTMATILAALDAHQGRVHGSARGDSDRLRLGEIADELERTHKELDAKRRLIKAQPTLEAKQPHSRAAMKIFGRLKDLYDEADAITAKLDPTSLLPFVSRPMIGTEFREILAAIWGRDMTIDGVPLFPADYRDEVA